MMPSSLALKKRRKKRLERQMGLLLAAPLHF